MDPNSFGDPTSFLPVPPSMPTTGQLLQTVASILTAIAKERTMEKCIKQTDLVHFYMMEVPSPMRCPASPSPPVSVAFQTVFVLSYITPDQKGGWEVILNLNRHEEILGTGTREVDAWGGDGTNAPVFGETRGGVGSGIISELFQSCGLRLDAPAGTEECPLLANNVISATRWHRSFPLHNIFYNSIDTTDFSVSAWKTDSG